MKRNYGKSRALQILFGLMALCCPTVGMAQTYTLTAQSNWFEGEDIAGGNWFIYNVGTQTFVGDDGILKKDVNASVPWQVKQNTSGLINPKTTYQFYHYYDNQYDYFYMEYTVLSLAWDASIVSDNTMTGATDFTVSKEESGYKFTKTLTNTRYFNVDDENNSEYSAARTNSLWNSWRFVSIAQVKAYNEYVAAFNEAQQCLNWPLPDCIKSDLSSEFTALKTALSEGSNTNYSQCKGNNGTTAKLRAAIAPIKEAWTNLLIEEDMTSNINVNPSTNSSQNISMDAGYYELSATLKATAAGTNISLIVGGSKTPFTMTSTSTQNCTSLLYYHPGGTLTIRTEGSRSYTATNLQLKRYTDYYNVTIGEAKYATLSLPFNAIIPDGVTVYTSDAFDPATRQINLVEVKDVLPAATGVILRTDNPGTYTFEFDCGTSVVENNILDGTEKGRLPQADRDETTYAYYVLANRNSHVAMYRLGTATIPQYRAYLKLASSIANTTASQIEHVSFNFGTNNDEPSVVSEDGGFVDTITTTESANDNVIGIYAPNGSRLQQLQKGVNIIQLGNGKTKKVII